MNAIHKCIAVNRYSITDNNMFCCCFLKSFISRVLETWKIDGKRVWLVRVITLVEERTRIQHNGEQVCFVDVVYL